MGQAILVRETMPTMYSSSTLGKRLLGYPHAQAPVTLQLLKPGEVFGWASLVRGVA